MIYKRGRYYWTRFHWKAEIIDKPTRATTKRTAGKIESKIRSELAEGNYGILQPRQAPVLKDFFKDEFLPFIETKFKASPKSAIYYKQGAKRVLSSSLARLRLDEITDQHAGQFAAKLNRYSPSTINQALRTLRRALRLAEQWHRLDRAPKVTLAPGERQRDRILTDEEMRLYITACAQPWRDCALMMFCLGLRPSEIYGLRWEQITLTETGLIEITKGKSKAARRLLPLVPEVRSILQSRHLKQGAPAEGWVFPSGSKSGHLEQNSAKNQHARAIEKVNETSKLKPFPPYCLRHTALTNLSGQCDTFTLKTIAGHSSITITQRYIHPQAQAITQAFEKLSDRQRVVTDGSDTPKTTNLEQKAKMA